MAFSRLQYSATGFHTFPLVWLKLTFWAVMGRPSGAMCIKGKSGCALFSRAPFWGGFFLRKDRGSHGYFPEVGVHGPKPRIQLGRWLGGSVWIFVGALGPWTFFPPKWDSAMIGGLAIGSLDLKPWPFAAGKWEARRTARSGSKPIGKLKDSGRPLFFRCGSQEGTQRSPLLFVQGSQRKQGV